MLGISTTSKPNIVNQIDFLQKVKMYFRLTSYFKRIQHVKDGFLSGYGTFKKYGGTFILCINN